MDHPSARNRDLASRALPAQAISIVERQSRQVASQRRRIPPGAARQSLLMHSLLMAHTSVLRVPAIAVAVAVAGATDDAPWLVGC